MKSERSVQNFSNEVLLKYQLYNSLFLSLPFSKIERTGLLLSLLSAYCDEAYLAGKSPEEIIEDFFTKNELSTKLKEDLDLLFHFVQYIERQVVLFDAIEDAAYTKVNDMDGQGTLKQIASSLPYQRLPDHIKERMSDFTVKLVLTAHPTQFYPGSVLGIINDLSLQLKNNNAEAINQLLQQLGKTPFLKKTKPSPYDEAMSLIWYLENVFYGTISYIIDQYGNNLPFLKEGRQESISLGFWPGGDRDGNPFVTYQTTIEVAQALRKSIFKCYYNDVRKLKRRLTFPGIDNMVLQLEQLISNQIYSDKTPSLGVHTLYALVDEIHKKLVSDHDGLFEADVALLMIKIKYFGTHFASIDIRQENDIHTAVVENLLGEEATLYNSLNDDQKLHFY